MPTLPADATLADAYAFQAASCAQRERAGERKAGYKVGCTSPATQGQMEIDHPVRGCLFASEAWPSGAELPMERFEGLGVEGELAVRLGADLAPGGDAAASVAEVFAVIELHHMRRLARQSAAALVAANAIHAGFVYAPPAPLPAPSDAHMLRLDIGGETVATVTGEQLIRTVTTSLDWLAGELRAQGQRLRAGETVLCGSIARLFPVQSACVIAVATDAFGSVDCRIKP